MAIPTIADIRAAADRIAGAVEHTPFLNSRTLSEIIGTQVWLTFIKGVLSGITMVTGMPSRRP